MNKKKLKAQKKHRKSVKRMKAKRKALLANKKSV